MKNPNTSRFIGTWHSDPDDPQGLKDFGEVTLKFEDDGTLIYKIHLADRDQIMNLTFLVEPEFIVTNQASDPRVERTKYYFTPDGKLILSFGGKASRYIRLD